MRLSISTPNDYDSDLDMERAIGQCYAGDEDAASSDEFAECYEVLAIAAKESGLLFVRETDYGAIWEGTAAQCENAIELLPEWAYTAKDDEA